MLCISGIWMLHDIGRIDGEDGWNSPKTEGLDDSTIAIDVAIIQVIEQCTTLSYKLCQRTCCSIIFTVLLKGIIPLLCRQRRG